MIFELRSDGKISRLPDHMALEGVPSYFLPRVVLFLPYNRMIIGTSIGETMDSWYYGKIGTENWKEVFLYEGQSIFLKDKCIPDVELSAHAVGILKSHLLEQLRPPGSHISTLIVLRKIRMDNPIFTEGSQWTNEKWVLSKLAFDDALRYAYWGIRRALVQSNNAMLERIKVWFSLAPDIDPMVYQYPQIWFSLTDLPGERELKQIEDLGFSRENLLQMNSNFSNPVVLSNAIGYLVLLTQYSGDDKSELRIWMYISLSMWEELRRKKKMSIREIVSACWGYLDAVEADIEMSRYGRLRKSIEIPHEKGSIV